MSMCARAVALWLAACALAARAQAERPECTHPNCKWVESGKGYEFYLINGEQNYYRTVDNVLYARTCSPSVALDDPAWPRFPNPEIFEYIELTGCAPPADSSYAAALKALNVPVSSKLGLFEIPADSRVSAASLADLSNVKWLTLGAAVGAPVLMLEPGSLTEFNELYVLELNHVQADRLPRNVSELTLINVEILPPGAFDVDRLWIEDSTITSINASVSRIKDLTLSSMRSLVSLALHNISNEFVQESLVENCLSLEVLELRYVDSKKLSADLLKNAMSLKTFTCTDGVVTTLPPTLFTHSPHLKVVDVSRNKLESLPSEVFSGLSELRELRLDDNRLSAHELRALWPLTALTTLDLSGNPLGDLCSSEKALALPLLRHLQELSMARTGAPRVCTKWLADLHALLFLDLHGNDVHTISCEDLRVKNVPGSSSIIVDLQDNPLEQFYCSQDDSTAILEPRKVILKTDSIAKCDCNCPFVKCVGDSSIVPNIRAPATSLLRQATSYETTMTATTSYGTTEAATTLDEGTMAETTSYETTEATTLDESTMAETTSYETTEATTLDESTLAASPLDDPTSVVTTSDLTRRVNIPAYALRAPYVTTEAENTLDETTEAENTLDETTKAENTPFVTTKAAPTKSVTWRGDIPDYELVGDYYFD